MPAALTIPEFLASPTLDLGRPFTRQQARLAGLTANQLTALCATGVLRRLMQALYVGGQVPDSLALRVEALGLCVPEGCFVADHTAAWLHAGDRALPPNAHLEVPAVAVFRPADAGRLRNGLCRSGERTLRQHDLMVVDGILTTTPRRTAMDIGRLFLPDVALWGLDCMLGTGSFQREDLLGDLDRLARQRGVVQLRTLAPLADGSAASFGEAALRRRWYDAGLPRPTCQIPIRIGERVVFVLDIGIEDHLFAAEYDGVRWHSAPDDVAYDAGRREWLTLERDWHIEVFREADVFGQHQTATDRLAQAWLAHQQLRGVRPPRILL